MIGNVTAVLLQPVVFFRSLPASRHWIWVGLLMLIVTGFSAVNQPALEDAIPPGEAPAIELPPGAMSPGGGSMGGIDGGFIAPNDPSLAQTGAPAPDVSKTVMTALLAATGVLVAWFIQALVLSEVTLINGTRPGFGLNLQIAIWASVPLALMLVIQQLYFAAGGKPGMMGISLVLERWAGFQTLPAFSQTVLTTVASNFTLFWLWNLGLLYIGGRIALSGKRAAVTLVVVAWVLISVLVPALTSIGKPAPAAEDAETITMPGNFEQITPGNMEVIPSDIKPQDTESESSAPGPNQVRPIIRGMGG
jgi:hypothetical protein